jgi:hypothetical protein
MSITITKNKLSPSLLLMIGVVFPRVIRKSGQGTACMLQTVVQALAFRKKKVEAWDKVSRPSGE